MCAFASRKGYSSKTGYLDLLKEDINNIKEDILNYYHSFTEPQPIILAVPSFSPP